MKRKRLLSLLLAICMLFSLVTPLKGLAQETEPNGVWGDANWIWDALEPGQTWVDKEDTWVSFRKTIELDQQPQSAIANIAVESRYWLYINGEMVVFEGQLKRGPNSADHYYDEVDLTPYLHKGSNTIAVLVCNWGMPRTESGGLTYSLSNNPTGQGGLIFSADVDGEKIVSDSTWKVKQYEAYQFSRSKPGPYPNIRLNEHNVYYDAGLEEPMLGWENAAYDDTSWQKATTYGEAGCAPWNELHKRPIPLLKDFGLKEYLNMDDYRNVTLTEDTTLDMVVPYNAQITPYLEIEAPAGLEIDIRTETYLESNSGQYSVRNVYKTKEGYQKFEVLNWFNGEHVYYKIPAGVKIIRLQYRETGYNTEFAGSFSSDDEFLDTLWQKSLRTLYITMRDNYMDCPDRERAQWWGDVTNEMYMTMYSLDQNANKLYEKGVESKIGFTYPDGRLRTVAPALGWNFELPMQELAGMVGMWDYYLYTGEESVDVLASAYDSLKTYAMMWTMSQSGLVNHFRAGAGHDDCGDWMDWGNESDVPVIENAWYYMAMESLSKMAKLLGKDEDIEEYSARMRSIEMGYRELWTDIGYLSAGKPDQSVADERGNALAVLSGLADESQYETILKQVFQKAFQCSPYMEKFVLDAMVKMDCMEQAQERMKKRYAPMVDGDEAISTLWEAFRKDGGTQNHAWSGGPLVNMSRDMAGVAPLTAGYKTYRIKPDLGTLNQISVSVPAVIGDIKVELRRDEQNKAFSMDVFAPEGGQALIAVPRFENEDESISINGQTVFEHGVAAGRVDGILYSHNDSKYIYFDAQPGSYSIREKSCPASQEATQRVTIQSTQGGTLKVDGTEQATPYAADVATGTTVRVEAVADEGMRFAGFSGSIGSNSETVSVTANNPVNLLATFEPIPAKSYAVVRIEDPGHTGIEFNLNGRTMTAPALLAVTPGDTVKLKALNDPADNYRFASWSGDLYCADKAFTFQAQSDATLYLNGIYQAAGNLAAGAQAITDTTAVSNWPPSNLVDGDYNNGFSTESFGSKKDLDAPYKITLDLKSNQMVDSVLLYPRRDAMVDGKSPNYPEAFEIKAGDSLDHLATVATVDSKENPGGEPQKYAFDSVQARYIQLSITRVGDAASDEPGNNRIQIMEIEAFASSDKAACQLSLGKTGTGAGRVAVNGVEHALPYTASYPKGARLAVEAIADEQNQFTGWEGLLSSGNRVVTLQMNKSISLDAQFIYLGTDLPGEGSVVNFCRYGSGVTAAGGNPDGGLPTWGASLLIDGLTEGNPNGAKGFTTKTYPVAQYPNGDISGNPHNITIDLGVDRVIDSVSLYPRTDVEGVKVGSGLAPNFPEDFSIWVKAEGANDYTLAKQVTGYTGVGWKDGEQNFKLDASVNARYVRIETTKLGKAAHDEQDNPSYNGPRVQLTEIEVYGDLSNQNPVVMGGVELPESVESLAVGETTSVEAVVTDSSLADNSLIFSIEDEKGFPSKLAAIVESDGNRKTIEARSPGSAYLTARFANGLPAMAKVLLTFTGEQEIDRNADYALVNKATGQVLERTLDTSYIPDRSDVFRVIAASDVDSDNQRWQLTSSGTGYRPVSAANRTIGLHKTAESYEGIAGANYVMAVDSNSPPMQTWEIQDLGNGYITLKNDLREATGGHDLPQYLAVTTDEYAEAPGSFVVAAIANSDTDRAQWRLEKVETEIEPLEPFEPVKNAVADAQTPLAGGSVKLTGMVDQAAVHAQNDELKKLDWKKLVDQFRYKTDTDNRWRSEFWGKYMRGASFTYAYTQDEELYSMLETSVRDLLSTQEASGRITSYPSDWGLWDIWGRKYVMLGLESFLGVCRDEALYNEILEALCRHADYMLRYLGPASDGKTPIVNIGDWCGIASCSILEPMVDLYRLTGYQRYLDFSTYIVNTGLTNTGTNIFDLALQGEKIPSRYLYNKTKAYELTSCFEGLAEYYRITGEEKWLTACLNYYRLASENEITVCGSGGGVGRGAGYDYPNPNGDEQWNNMAVNQTDPTIGQMQETCITVTWMKYCNQMLRLVGESTIADDIEISAYNALIGALKAEGVETNDYPFLFDYFSLLNGTRKNPWGGAIFDRDGSPIGSCCSANGSSGTGLVPYIELMRTDHGVVFNLYNPGQITASTPSGIAVGFDVDTAYPKEGSIRISVHTAAQEEFAVSLRIPKWSAQTTLKVNGQDQPGVTAGEYTLLNRVWNEGDIIELTLDMRTRVIDDAKGLGMIALQRGPITLARDARFGENVDKPVSIAMDEDGYAMVTPYETDLPCNMAFAVQTTDGPSIHMMDYASAGQTWDSNSRYATWLTTSEAVDPGLKEGAQYYLTCQGTGLSMKANLDNDNVERGSKLTGDSVADNELWQFVPAGDYYKIVNLQDGKLLSVNPSGGVGNGSNILIAPDSNSDRQLWTVSKSGDGFIKITAKLAKQLVSEAGGSENIHLWEDVTSPAQVWKLNMYKMPVDKTGLTDALAAASAYEGKESEYTEQSWKAFRDALAAANAVNENPDASEDAVKEATTALNAAIVGLTKNEPPLPSDADKTILKRVLDYAAEAIKGDEYAGVIPSVKASFDAAYAQADRVYRDQEATQSQVDSAWIGLMKEIHKLGFQAGSKQQLELLLFEADKIDLSDYVEKGQKEFGGALAKAESCYNDADALQNQVEEAVAELLQAMARLRFKADKDVLARALAEAAQIDTASYTEQSVEAFNAAQAAGNDLMKNDALSQDDQAVIDQAAADLNQAIANLALKPAVAGDAAAGTGSGSARTGETTPFSLALAALSLAGAWLILKKRSHR